MRPILIIALTLLVTSGGGVWADGDAPPAQRPWTEQAFLGLSLRDTPAGTVVGWIRPGPLGGGVSTPGRAFGVETTSSRSTVRPSTRPG